MRFQSFIIAVLIALTTGFFIGRVSTQKGKTVRYIPGKTVSGKVARDVLQAKVEFLTDIKLIPHLYWKQDTIREVITLVPDSAAIINDYMTKRQYEFTLFDDTTGKLVAMPTVLHNRLLNFEYKYTPVQKRTTIVREKKVRPFLSSSFNTFQTLGVGGGVMLNGVGVEYNYLHNFRSNMSGHEIGLKFEL